MYGHIKSPPYNRTRDNDILYMCLQYLTSDHAHMLATSTYSYVSYNLDSY